MTLIKQIRTLVLVVLAATVVHAVPTSQNPADKVVAKYQAAPAAEVVAKLKADLSSAKYAKDPAKVEARIRKEFGDFVLEDAEGARFKQLVWEIIKPVFEFSGRDKSFRLLILKTVDPIAFVDDGCVVVLSTGMVMAANSEDALVGLVAHEQAHILFAERTASARKQLEVAQEQGNKTFEESARNALNLIEYECDAVATLQLSAMGYNPLRFMELLDGVGAGIVIVGRVGHYQPSTSTPEHEARRQVVTRLASAESVKVVYSTNRLLPLQAAIRRARGEK